MRLGDYIVFVSMLLNFSAMCAYAYQQHYAQAWYWFAAFNLNLSLVMMK